MSDPCHHLRAKGIGSGGLCGYHLAQRRRGEPLHPVKPHPDWAKHAPAFRITEHDLLAWHADLYRVVRRLELGGHVPPTALSEYRAFGVRSGHVHRNKADHARALRLLMRSLDPAHLPPLVSEDAGPGRVAAEFIEAHPPTPAEAKAT